MISSVPNMELHYRCIFYLSTLLYVYTKTSVLNSCSFYYIIILVDKHVACRASGLCRKPNISTRFVRLYTHISIIFLYSCYNVLVKTCYYCSQSTLARVSVKISKRNSDRKYYTNQNNMVTGNAYRCRSIIIIIVQCRFAGNV